MANYHVGIIIKHWRVQLGISRESLASDIMSVSALSRLECGKTMPTKYTIDALFEKMGLNSNSLTTIFLNDEMIALQKIQDELDIALDGEDIELSERIINRLDNHDDFKKDKLNHQYLIAAKAVNEMNKGTDRIVILQMLKDALITPRKSIDEDHLDKGFLTALDCRILNILAILYHQTGETERAIKILYGVKQYIEKKCHDPIEKGRRYPQTIYHLSKYLAKAGNHREAIEACNQGKTVCIQTAWLSYLPYIESNRAYSLYELGAKDKCAELLCMIYHNYKLQDLYKEMENIKSYAASIGIAL